jgi:hypothetical protein
MTELVDTFLQLLTADTAKMYVNVDRKRGGMLKLWFGQATIMELVISQQKDHDKLAIFFCESDISRQWMEVSTKTLAILK